MGQQKTPAIQFDETEDVFDICRDNVFKAVFARETPLSHAALSKLVSALIGREISVLELCANEPPIDNLRDRQIRYDINCQAADGELINVEMSLNPRSLSGFALFYKENAKKRSFLAFSTLQTPKGAHKS